MGEFSCRSVLRCAQEVDFSTHTAVICYVSGEKETLDLKEIAQERHMSLIPPEFYGARS